ncbi:hypothetical protein ACUSIJ_11840 [Pseudochelatococcus sp. B33]
MISISRPSGSGTSAGGYGVTLLALRLEDLRLVIPGDDGSAGQELKSPGRRIERTGRSVPASVVVPWWRAPDQEASRGKTMPISNSGATGASRSGRGLTIDTGAGDHERQSGSSPGAPSSVFPAVRSYTTTQAVQHDGQLSRFTVSRHTGPVPRTPPTPLPPVTPPAFTRARSEGLPHVTRVVLWPADAGEATTPTGEDRPPSRHRSAAVTAPDPLPYFTG